MKNAKLKIKNEGEDGKLGNEEKPMVAGCSAPSASGVGQVQSLRFKVQGWETEVDEEAKFEYLPLKITFSAEVDVKEMEEPGTIREMSKVHEN